MSAAELIAFETCGQVVYEVRVRQQDMSTRFMLLPTIEVSFWVFAHSPESAIAAVRSVHKGVEVDVRWAKRHDGFALREVRP